LFCADFFYFLRAKYAGTYTLSWIDTDYGTIYDTPDLCIELRKNHTFTYNGKEGKWSAKGDKTTLTYDSKDTATLYCDGEYLKQNFYDYSIGSYEYTFRRKE